MTYGAIREGTQSRHEVHHLVSCFVMILWRTLFRGASCARTTRLVTTRSPEIGPEQLEGLMPEFIRNNAGKAFEFMVEKVDEDRKSAGLGTVEEAFAGEGRGEKRGNRNCYR